MRVFDSKDGWFEKVNFVDNNNVYLGYDLSQDCCEDADWFISDQLNLDLSWNKMEAFRNNKDKKLNGYYFDTTFHLKLKWDWLDAGEVICFSLIKDLDEATRHRKFLYLFNCQNGYYGHGFEFKIGDEIELQGVL